MALMLNIEDLLNKQKIESNRIEFKKGWNPVTIYHSICAFANDFDDLGGGYILVGVDTDENGVAKRPVVGIPEEQIDDILQDMIGYNAKFGPYYMPRTSTEDVDGKKVLVIWCPAGVNRPYSIPENVTAKHSKEYFYVRCGTSSIIAKGEVLDELRDLAGRVPFDDRGNPDIKIEDISIILLRDHLVKAGSKLAGELFKRPLEEILEQMDLYTGPSENRMLKNVAAMMFCEQPDKFFKYMQVDVVVFPDGKIQNPSNFRERTFKGSVPQIVQQTMTFFKTEILYETVQKVSGQSEALRFWNYPYDALEEAVVNALYHRDYRQYEPVEITIEPDCTYILNCPGPDRSISAEAIAKGDILKSRRYRNRRLGDFLKEIDLTEGRSTGVPTIQEKLKFNGSPRATFESGDDRLTFLITIPIHEGCEKKLMSVESSEKHDEMSVENDALSVEMSVETNKRSVRIRKIMKAEPTITLKGIAELLGVTSRTIERTVAQMINDGDIIHEGPKKGGTWKVLK